MSTKVLLVPDVDWWVFHRVAMVVKSALEPEFEVRVAYSSQKGLFPEDFQWADIILFWNYDYYVNWQFPFELYQKKTLLRVCAHVGMGNEQYPERINNQMKGVVASSLQLAEMFRDKGIKAYYISDYVDLSKFSKLKMGKIRKNFENKDWGWAGREQGTIKGLSIMEEAAKDFPNFHVAGGKIREENMPEFYSQIGLYVNMSETEGTPMPVLEACARGIPVISTAVGVVPELAKESTGVIVIERSPEALKQALKEFFSLPINQYKTMCDENRLAVNRFGIDTVKKQYLEQFRLWSKEC
jgi:hypothetical protein